MAIITKNDIINGKNDIQEIEFKTLKGSLRLRPLTDGEFHKVSAIIQRGGVGKLKTKPVMKNGVVDKEATMKALDFDLDIGEADKAKYESDCKAILYSLDHKENKDDDWKIEDIKSFPVGAVSEVVVAVYKISGVDDPNKTRGAVEEFRNGE